MEINHLKAETSLDRFDNLVFRTYSKTYKINVFQRLQTITPRHSVFSLFNLIGFDQFSVASI